MDNKYDYRLPAMQSWRLFTTPVKVSHAIIHATTHWEEVGTDKKMVELEANKTRIEQEQK